MIPAIASTAFRECTRRAFPYITVLTVVMLVLASSLLGLFSFGAGGQETANLALSGILLAGLLNAAFVGTALIRTDLERGTLALMLSQPVGPAAYVAGRFLGLAAATLLLCCLAGGGIALALAAAGTPAAVFSTPLLLGSARVALAMLVLAAAALAVSAAATRLFAPVLLVALFVAGDAAGSGALGRLLPAFGLFGIDVAANPPLPWLALYAVVYSVVFLGATYVQLVLRPPTRTES